MTEQIDLNVKYTVDDYVRALRYIQSRQFIFRYAYIITPVVGLISFLIVFILTPNRSLEMLIVALIIIPILLAAVFVIKRIPNPLTKIFVSIQFKSSPAMQEEQIISFDDEGIKGGNNLTSGVTKWDAVIKAFESKDDFFFYTAKNFAIFFPKSAFTTIEEQNQLKELAREKLGEKAKF